jgi:hypothetical protein
MFNLRASWPIQSMFSFPCCGVLYSSFQRQIAFSFINPQFAISSSPERSMISTLFAEYKELLYLTI